MSINQNEFEAALKILKNYYGKLAREISTDIIQNKDSFESDDMAFNQAEDILEKHATKLYRLSTVFSNLRQFARTELPKGEQAIGKDEFRCFGCGAVIRRNQKECAICGWTWML
jgi:rRNA maturation endonuclease Nob1